MLCAVGAGHARPLRKINRPAKGAAAAKREVGHVRPHGQITIEGMYYGKIRINTDFIKA